MVTDALRDLVQADHVPGVQTGESATICPLVADTGNRQLLEKWVDDQEQYERVSVGSQPLEQDFDLCIADQGAFRERRTELEALKAEADPVLLPVLALLPENPGQIIEADQGGIADNVITTTIDEVVTLPIKQKELSWRIQSLLRLRAQTIESVSQRAELDLFKQAIDASGAAVYITDTDGTIKYVNPAFEEITGFDSDDAVGETPQILDSGENPDGYFEDLWTTIRSGEQWQDEIRNRRKDGTLYTATQTISPMAENGDVSAFVAVQADITERKQREEQLRRRTRAIDEAPVGVSIADPDRDDNPLIYVNDAFVSMTGYPREEILGKNCRFLQGENTDPDRVARIREAIDAEEPISIELRNYRNDGSEFWNHLEMAPVMKDAGEVVNWIGFQQDVSDRKEREQELKTERRFIAQALDALNDLFYVSDEDGNLRRWNDRVSEVTGHSDSELAGMHVLDQFPDDEHQRVGDAIEMAHQDGDSIVETELLTADGQSIPYEFTGARLTDDDGTTTGLVGIGRDLTESRQRERRFRALVEKSNDIIAIVNEEGSVEYLSPSFERILGYDADEILEDTVWEYIHPKDRESTIEQFTAWANNPDSTASEIEFRARHKDGSWRWVEAEGTDQVGNPAVEGYVLNIREITDRKERQRQLQVVDRVLRHNVRNDMNVIRGQAKMIQADNSGDVAASAEQIIDSSDHLLGMAEKERQITERMWEEPTHEEIDVSERVQDIASRIRSDYPDATVSVESSAEATIQVTRKFGQALRELVTNGIVHNDSSSPEVTITVSQNSEGVQIEIADHGPCIPEVERDLLSEQTNQTQLDHGSGLGLWLVKLITARSGGTITIEENSPAGNIVSIELPR